jgi:alcohol dehydrogenase
MPFNSASDVLHRAATINPAPRRSRLWRARTRVASQPPGDIDESFGGALPSYRGSLVVPAGDHFVRQHHTSRSGASSFFAPPFSLLGQGALQRLGNVVSESGAKRCLVVSQTKHLRDEDEKDVLKRLCKELFDAGTDAFIFSDVELNATTENVAAALLMAYEYDVDSIISAGGGSAHDVAKAVRALYRNPEQDAVQELVGVDEIAAGWIPAVPHFAVSTCMGACSALTRLAVITDPLHQETLEIVDWRITPSVSCDDTLLMLEQPREIIAAAGVESLAHACEAFLSNASTPVTDANALHAIRLLSSYLRAAVTSTPKDTKALDMINYGMFLAGVSFNSAGLGLSHAIANALCAKYINLPSSELLAVMLPHVLEFYGEQSEEMNDDAAELFVDLAEAMGCPKTSSPASAVKCVVQSVARLVSDVELPQTLSEVNARQSSTIMRIDDVPEIAAKAMCDCVPGVTSARHPTLGEAENLILQAWRTSKCGECGDAFIVDAVAKPEANETKKNETWVQRYNWVGSDYVV